jgi:hypothetical protein
VSPLRGAKKKERMGNISSINIKPVKDNSQIHNERLGELNYVYSELTKDNETWKSLENGEISSRLASISALYKKQVGQKMQAKSTPIREAVVNMREDHTMEDLKRLAADLKKEYNIEAFQIHIHRDEGYTKKFKSKGELKEDIVLNRHAHILFDWQDKSTGRSIKLARHQISQMQEVTAKSLGMKRGELKENSNTERLEAVAFKQKKIEENLKEIIPELEKLKIEKDDLQEQTNLLEQKKIKLNESIQLWQKKTSEILEKKSSQKPSFFQKISKTLQLKKLKEPWNSNLQKLKDLKEKVRSWRTNTQRSKALQTDGGVNEGLLNGLKERLNEKKKLSEALNEKSRRQKWKLSSLKISAPKKGKNKGMGF